MNQSIFDLFYSLAHRNSFLDWLWVFMAEYLPLIIAVYFVFMLFSEKNNRRRWYFAALATLAIIISYGVVTPVLRAFIESPRPFTDSGITALIGHINTNSVPSGHVMVFFPIALAALYINRRVGTYLVWGIALMGISRIIVGVHWPADVFWGFVLAGGSFYLARYLLSKGGVKDELA